MRRLCIAITYVVFSFITLCRSARLYSRTHTHPRPHTPTLSLSLSLSHTHTYIHTYTHTSPASPAAAAWTCIVVPFWDYNHITIIYVTSWNTSHHHKRYIICMNDKYFYITHTYICMYIYIHLHTYIFVCYVAIFLHNTHVYMYRYISMYTYIYTLCHEASLSVSFTLP